MDQILADGPDVFCTQTAPASSFHAGIGHRRGQRMTWPVPISYTGGIGVNITLIALIVTLEIRVTHRPPSSDSGDIAPTSHLLIILDRIECISGYRDDLPRRSVHRRWLAAR